ncbi:chromosome partitioning protein ParA (plasmid) [Peptoclostridium acidaminophilum DSM 3953]|uniref:Chromosome partitioning protein ParA n=2 Tax=Peptoclostridium acidaminophilum TaxID=1731 RepID=W8T6Z1_PEPAC|nr:chromosome partitioning protein ParA [Peptoclostridium acidaminophilum DSM 3953]
MVYCNQMKKQGGDFAVKGKVLFENIRNRRLEVEFTQQDLANTSGLSLSLIKAIETGRSESGRENIEKISAALGVAIDDIYIGDYRETKVVSIANNKGGSGKTSVVAGLGYALAEKGYKILFVDGDAQFNLSYSLGMNLSPENSLNHAIINENSLMGYIQRTAYDNMDIIVSDFDMALIEMKLFTKVMRESVMRKILEPVVEAGIYDFILIDTNPTLGILNFNILNASDYVIIPVELSSFGIIGLNTIKNYINEIRTFNRNLELAGVLMNKVDKRESITDDAQDVLEQTFGEIVFKSYISVDTNIKKAQWDRQPLDLFNRNSRATKQFKSFAEEVIRIVK